MKYIFLFLIGLTVQASQAAMNCVYTSEVAKPQWSRDEFPQFSAPPIQFSAAECEKPICAGNVWCSNGKGSGIVTKTLCFAFRSKAGWECPRANDCADDNDIVISVDDKQTLQITNPRNGVR